MNHPEMPYALRVMTFAIIALVSAPTARAVITFSETNFGQIGVGESYVTGINNKGDVIGMFASATNPGGTYAFGIFAGSIAGGVTSQPTLTVAGGYNDAGQLNNLGQGIGYSSGVRGTDGNTRAMLWQSGAVTDLTSSGLVGIATALGINDGGHIVGRYIDYQANRTSGYVWSSGAWQVVDPSSGAANTFVDLVGINNTGQIIGTWRDASRVSHSFLRQADGTVVSLGFTPTGINNLGQVVGYETTVNGTSAVIWQAGEGHHRIESFGINSFLTPYHLSINDHGEIGGQNLARQAAVFTPGGTLLWVGPTGGRFSAAANWDSGGYFPSVNLDVAMAPEAGALSAVADADATMRNLSIGTSSTGYKATLSLADATLTTQQDLRIGAFGVLAGSGRIVAGGAIHNAGRINANDLTLQGPFDNEGSVSVTNLTVQGLFTNHGAVSGNGRLVADVVNMGTLSVSAGQTLALNGAAHSNGGVLRVQGGTLSIEGLLTNQIDTPEAYWSGQIAVGNGGRLSLLSGMESNNHVAVTSGGTIDAHGAVTLGQLSIAAQGTWTGDAAVTAKGSIVVERGGSFSAGAFTLSSGTLTVDGTLDTGVGVTTRITGGVLNGTGLINGGLFVGGGPTTASFKPGHSPGRLDVDGEFKLLPGGVLELEVQRGTDGLLAFDLVSASHMTLDGLVLIQLGSDLDVGALQELHLLDCGTGCEYGANFDWRVQGGSFAPGVSFTANGLQLTLSPSPVPEPSAWITLALGLAALSGKARTPRRHGQAAQRK